MDDKQHASDETLTDSNGIPIKRRNLEAWMPQATQKELEMTVGLNERLLDKVLPRAFAEIAKFQWPAASSDFASSYERQFINLTIVAMEGIAKVDEEEDELVGEGLNGDPVNNAVVNAFWQWLEFVGHPLQAIGLLEILGLQIPETEHARFREHSLNALHSLQSESARALAFAKAEIAKRAFH